MCVPGACIIEDALDAFNVAARPTVVRFLDCLQGHRIHSATYWQPTYPINICEKDERADSYDRFLVHNVEFLGDSSGEETRSKESCTSLGNEAGRRGKTINNFGRALCWWWRVGAHRTTTWMALLCFVHEAKRINIRRDGPSDGWHRAWSGYRNELFTVPDRKAMQPDAHPTP